MNKFVAPIVLFILAAGVVAYLLLDFSGAKSSFDVDAYLQARSKIDSLEIVLWESADKPDVQLAVRTELETSWETLNALRAPTNGVEGSDGDSESGISGDTVGWIIGGVIAVILCVILLLALSHHKKVVTMRMEALKAEQRFKEPKNGFENDPTLVAPRPRPQKHSIIDDVVGESAPSDEASLVQQKVVFEDENGVPENKILSEDLNAKPTLRPTAKERITSAMQSLSDVLRAPHGVTRDRTMKIRAQSHNATSNPGAAPQSVSPLKTNRFDREFTEKTKILQMSRRGFPASAIATNLKIPQDQVEAIIREAQESGN
ncbi:MAG: hypothetical protein MJY82_09310 [Fibrobacter sp.]|nr:hypothetical protein [Fibrobacter sp.]